MKILLMSMGTRGDMDPFFALGDMLHKNGHDIAYAMPDQFKYLANSDVVDFYSFDKRFLEMLDSTEAKNVMGQKGSLFQRFKDIRTLFKEMKVVNKVFLQQQWNIIQREKPDRIVFHPKVHLPYLWGKANPNKSTFLFPLPHLVHPVYHAPPIPLTKSLGKPLNILAFKCFNYFTIRYMLKSTKDYQIYFPKIKFTSKSLLNHMLFEAKSMLMITREFFKKPEYWKENVQVLGYRERDKHSKWKPSAGLSDFIKQHEKILFITFGSMPNANPEKPTQTILKVLEKLEIPAIINTFKGGLIEMEHKPNHVFFVNSIPYNWIFPQCYAVMHHGGSGTLHMATKYQCASLVIPHAVDQFFWNKKVSDLGLGPLGIPIKKMKEIKLEPLLLDLWNNQDYKEKAIGLGTKIMNEDYENEILEFLEL